MAKVTITFEDDDDGSVVFDFDCPEVNSEEDLTPAIMAAVRVCEFSKNAGLLGDGDE